MEIKSNKLLIKINSRNINKIIKKTRKIRKLCDKNNLKLEFIYQDKIKSKTLEEIEHAINIKDLEKRYSYIYDNICDYLDNKYKKCNYCDFKNDVCIYFRELKEFDHKNGCCYKVSRGGLCKYFKNKKCTIKSISCKLYSCEVLRNNKINFRMKYFPLIKYFFNLKQKYYIKYSFFEDKDYVLNKLLENI